MLQSTLEVHKDGAYILLVDDKNFKNVFPTNNGISDVLQSIINEILANILKTGSILLGLGIALIIVYGIIKSLRKAKREKDQYTPEN